MSALSEKILSIVYGTGFGLGSACMASSVFGSYLFGLLVGTVVFLFARRFWIFCSNQKPNQRGALRNGGLPDSSIIASRTDSTPWYLDSSQSSLVGNVYYRAPNNFSSNSTSCFDR